MCEVVSVFYSSDGQLRKIKTPLSFNVLAMCIKLSRVLQY